MAGEKIVIRNPVVEYQPAAGGAFVDISRFIKNCSPGPTQAEVDVAAYGDLGKATEKGPADHTLTFDAFHSRAFSEFSALMVTEFRSLNNTVFRVKYINGAITVDNPQFTMSVKVTKLGQFGGARGTASMLSAQWPIQGLITYDIGDGSPTLL